MLVSSFPRTEIVDAARGAYEEYASMTSTMLLARLPTILLMWYATATTVFSQVEIDLDLSNVVQISRSTPTLQVVTNPLLARDKAFQSPIVDKAFENLKSLDSRFTRYVPWFPFPKRAVAHHHVLG